MDAGYLLDKEFQKTYKVHKAQRTHMEYLKCDEFWLKFGEPFARAESDKQYLYVIMKIPPERYSVPGGGSCYVADSIPFDYTRRQDR